MSISAIIIIGLATWRIATDLADEHGPFGLYYLFRKAIKSYAERKIDASPVLDPKDHPLYWLYDGADCPICLSFWIALALSAFFLPYFLTLPANASLLTLWALTWRPFILHWLASAGLASLLYKSLEALKALAQPSPATAPSNDPLPYLPSYQEPSQPAQATIAHPSAIITPNGHVSATEASLFALHDSEDK